VLIPSIDLKGGKVVQLIQGDRLALETDDLNKWVAKFESFPVVQLIDLDAAMGSGNNNAIIQDIVKRLPCRVGGGIRNVARAIEVLSYGATEVIVGSSLFNHGQVDLTFAQQLSEAIGRQHIIAAVDSKNGHVVVKGWKETVPLTATEAIKNLEPYCDEFLYTHVDNEGLMQGTNLQAIMAVRKATTRRVTAAGGITTEHEIDELHRAGVDAVVGMAIYTGRLDINNHQHNK
jgi:phosphoribosylformimino-5-aminoimidazole carboxamide ribotide isomerase